MIRNESEYKEAVQRVAAEEQRIAAQKAELAAMGLMREQITRVIDPLQSFHLQLVEEVASYEKLRRREIDEIRNLRGIGPALIAVRIALGWTQRQLAEKLGVSETQVSRDERNEYHGVTLERAARILDAFGVDLRIGVALKEPITA